MLQYVTAETLTALQTTGNASTRNRGDAYPRWRDGATGTLVTH